MINIDDITEALEASWGSDTAFDPEDWSADNPARGQCVISSLVIQDYLGGDLARYSVEGNDIQETHYINRLSNGTKIDATAKQYKEPVTMTLKPIPDNDQIAIRKKRLSDLSTARRYEILRNRVSSYLNSTDGSKS